MHWDPYLHAWVVTRYADVVQVFQQIRRTARQLLSSSRRWGWSELGPIARVMVRQMLFLDPPEHTRVRGLAAAAFTPRRVERLRDHIQEITDSLIDAVVAQGEMDVMDDLANPLPAIVTAEMLGVPSGDHRMLKDWSQDFAEMLGNFQHNPGGRRRVLASVEAMTHLLPRRRARSRRTQPTEGLINALATAEVDGDRFTEEEVVANIIVTMVGGQETTTNLIGNGLLTLLRHPDELQRLREDPSLMPVSGGGAAALREPQPAHRAHRARRRRARRQASIREREAVIAVMGAANRDPGAIPGSRPARPGRTDNRHLAFALGEPLLFRRAAGAPGGPDRAHRHAATASPTCGSCRTSIEWRPNLGLRGLVALPVEFAT